MSRLPASPRIRSLAVVGIAAVLGNVLLQAPMASAASPRPDVRAAAASVTTTVPLSPGWRVKSTKQLIVSDGQMTCRPTSLVRSGSKPAKAVKVRCSGTAGASYPLTVSVKGVKAARSSVVVTFAAGGAGGSSAVTVEQVLAAAPLEVPIQGAPITIGQVSFIVPTGWSQQDYGNVFSMAGTDSRGYTCQVFVFQPVAPDFSAGEASLDQQLYAIANNVTGATLTGEYGGDVFHTRRNGNTGVGFPFVGLQLENAGTPVTPYMVIFAETTAVPVVQVGAACQHGFSFEVASSQIMQTLNVAGAPEDPATYRQLIVGMWTSSDGSAGNSRIYGANNHYASGSSTSGTAEFGGVLYSVTSSWAGDGAYVVFGPLVARFPNGGTPSSTLAVIFTEYRGTNAPTTFECEVHMGYGSSGVTKDTPFESCMSRTQ